jgi:hypothetical protein
VAAKNRDDKPGPDRKKITLDGTEQHDDACWWTKPELEIGPAMIRVAESYEIAQASRREQSRRYTQLWKGQRLTSSAYDAATPRDVYDDIHACWNVCQAIPNTAMSVVGRNRVRVAIQTSAADCELQEAAKDAELYIQGCWAGNKLYEEIDPLFFLDGAVTGLGAVTAEDSPDGDVILERIHPDEIVYSDVEALHGKPRQFFRVKWMSKWQVIELYGDTEEKRRQIGAYRHTYNVPLQGTVDKHIPMIPVWTGWFLPSRRWPKPGKDAKKDPCEGRRVRAIPGLTLEVRTWRWTRLPITFFSPEKSPAGLWGVGFVERAAGFQYKINELNDRIDEQARGGSLGKWAVEAGSNVNPDDLTDEDNSVVVYSKTMPEWKLNQGISTDLRQERTETYNQALKEQGMSEWMVGGKQPANIESGEGLRQLSEKEQGRALPCGQRWEDAKVDLAEVTLLAACDAMEHNPKLATVVEDKEEGGLRKIMFQDLVKLIQDPDAHKIQAFPTSILPSQPAARFDKLREWKAEGLVDAATFAALSEMPDLDQQSSIMLAGVKAVRKAIRNIIRKGAAGYEPPDATMPLGTPDGKPGFGIQFVQSTYLQGLSNGMPEEKLALLKDWEDAALELLRGRPAVPIQTPAAPAVTASSTPPQTVPPPAESPPPADGLPPATIPPDGLGVAPGDLGAMPAPVL